VTPAAPEPKGPSDFLVWWLAPIAIVVLGIFVWSNHFENGFHADDFQTIVNNRALRPLSNIPRFFTSPRTFNAEPENADYKPLLLTSFAVDAWITPANNPLIYQMDSFLWFGLMVLSLFAVFRVIPGTSQEVALFGTALFIVHPVAAETVNYIVQRGQIMGAAGVCLSLALWIVWPRMLPQQLGINFNRVPQTWWQIQLRTRGASWERLYKSFLKLPLGFYLIPLVPALLAEPAAAVFALLALVYVRLFDERAGYSRLLVPALVCGVYWLLQTALVWTVSPLFRIPLLDWWATQPWVAMRYLFHFVWPEGLSAHSGLKPLHMSQPVAWAGLAGVVALVACALVAGRSVKWRGVAFGLWWFLLALVPVALIPQRSAEANPRMFLASAGLAFAGAHSMGICIDWIRRPELNHAMRITASSVLGTGILALLGTFGWMTYERNRVWEDEKTLWRDVTEKSPENGHAFIEYAAAISASGDDAEGLRNLQKAVLLSADDGLLQLRLAQGFDLLNKDIDTEFHFRRSLWLAPRYSAAYASFGQWLFAHRRLPEAFAMSTKALELNAADLTARHTMMDLYSASSNWNAVAKLAKETLTIDPADPEGKRSLLVASASLDRLRQAEEDVKNSPTVDDYLKLSVLYFHNQRYEDSLKASREALRLRPRLAEGYANMATALHTLGRNDEAIAALREVIRLRPDMTFAKNDLQILLEIEGHPTAKH
jgi:tetratricopeptide (TPR) repeat protein